MNLELTYNEVEALFWSKVQELEDIKFSNKTAVLYRITNREIGDMIDRIKHLNVKLVEEDDRQNAAPSNG